MFCKNCGVEITEQDNFCPKCGTKINETENKSLQENKPISTSEKFKTIGELCTNLGSAIMWFVLSAIIIFILYLFL